MQLPSAIIGDLHLTRFSPTKLGDDLERMLTEHRGEAVVVAGDFFVSSDAPREQRREAIHEILGAHPVVRRALAEHLDRDGSILFCGGNHDCDVGDGLTEQCLREELPLSSNGRERLATRPWFIRYGGLHIEHGHFYDPDNAPAHPLVNYRHAVADFHHVHAQWTEVVVLSE